MASGTRMRIGVDARTIFSPRRRGTGKNLADLYRRIPLLAPSWDFYLYHQLEGVGTDEILPKVRNIVTKKIDMRGDRFNAWRNIRLPLIALWDRIDLLHCPAQNAPHYLLCPKVVTIHDITPLKLDMSLSWKSLREFRRNIQQSLETAAEIITVSEHSKKDLVETFGQQYGDKINVIYWAPEESCRPLRADIYLKTVKEKYSITAPYIFAFGDQYIRKNTRRLLESFAVFTKRRESEVQLVIAGAGPESIPPLKKILIDLGVEDRVIFAGFVPEEEIPYLLSGAEFLAFISLYEGFGLPPLDAMACDCPVIASNVTSIPEVVGDAAILVDPYDTARIADAMANLFNNTQLRQDLIAKGRTRVKLFSWEKAAAETLNVYKKVLGA